MFASHLRVSNLLCFLLPTDNFRYTCDICGKKYKYYSCFQEHRDLHAVDGESCFDTQTPEPGWEVFGEAECGSADLQDVALHGSAFFAMEAQPAGTAERSLFCLILPVCIKNNTCAGI